VNKDATEQIKFMTDQNTALKTLPGGDKYNAKVLHKLLKESASKNALPHK